MPEWIAYNGLTHIKIKLNGDNLDWDRERVLHVDGVCTQEMAKRGTTKWNYSLDFNEKCPNVEYLLTMLRQIREKTPAGFGRIQYIEQPTARPESQPAKRHARSRQTPSGGDRRIAYGT